MSSNLQKPPLWRLLAWLSVLICWLGLSSALAQTNDLNVDPQTVNVNEVVTASYQLLFDPSPKNVTTLDWGDGSTSDIKTPQGAVTHKYSQPGTYGILLLLNQKPIQKASVTVKQAYTCTVSASSPITLGSVSKIDLSVSVPINQGLYLDFGDGQGQNVTTGKSTSVSLTHTYKDIGVYLVQVTYQQKPLCQTKVQVVLSKASLELSPNPALVGETVTATPSGVSAGLDYSLDWGDGTSTAITSNTPQKHVYKAPGVYVVKLNVPGGSPVVVSLTVKLPTPTLSLSPNPALVGEQVSATLGNLVPGVSYSLDWGDGNTVPVTANTMPKHSYAAPGMYVVKLSAAGGAPVIANVTVKLPQPTLQASPNPARAGESVTITPGNLVKGVAYALDFGDGSSSAISGPLKHSYAAPGVYVLKLTADGLAPVTVTLRVDVSLEVQSLKLRFVRPEDRPSLIVMTGSKVDAALNLEYSGQGRLQGELLLDGKTLARVDLNARPGAREVGFPIPNLPTQEPGSHTLTYQPTPANGEKPILASPAAITYTVRPMPKELEIGGFVFKLVKVTEPSFERFAGTATHTLIVGGVEAFKNVKVSFRELKVQAVSDERVKVLSGEISLSLAEFKTTPLPAGLSGFSLKPASVLFKPTGATFDGLLGLATTCEPPSAGDRRFELGYLAERPFMGALLSQGSATRMVSHLPVMAPAGLSSARQVGSGQDARFGGLQKNAAALAFRDSKAMLEIVKELNKYCRPDPRYSANISAVLKPDSGDLYGSTSLNLSALKVPTTAFTLNGKTTLTLDLSAAQTADSVGSVLGLYDQGSAPKPEGGNAWMGVVLDQAQANLGETRTPPLSATLRSGYTFGADLGGGRFTDRGWTFTLSSLSLRVVENKAANQEGKASTRLPMLEEDAPVNLSLQDGKLRYTLAGSATHDFGKSTVSAGAGAWVESGEALDLRLTGTAWDMKGLSNVTPPSKQNLGEGLKGSRFAGNVMAVRAGQAASAQLSSVLSVNASSVASAALGNSTAASTSGPALTDSSGGIPVKSLGQVSVGGRPIIPKDASYQDGVLTLNTLVFNADGQVRFEARPPSSDGLSRATLSVPDFKMLGQTFNATHAVIGRSGTNYLLGVDGKQKLNPKTPSVSVKLRYRVNAGRDRELSLHTDGFENRVDPNAIFRVEPSDTVVSLSGTGMTPRGELHASVNQASAPSLGLRQVPGGFELTLKGGLDTGKDASVMKVSAEALFGLTDDPYFYVKAAIDSRSPIFSVLGAFNLYGFTGGVAYNMKWPDNATIPMYAKAPTKSGDHRLQIIGGLTAAYEQGNSLHFKALFKIDTQRGFELTADGWILTKMQEGVFGGKAPQSRMLMTVTGDGFNLMACLGPADVAGLDCQDLRVMTIADAVDVTGWLHMQIAGQKFIKVGTYGNPVRATLKVPVLDGVNASAYLIVGQALEDGDRKDNLKGTGIYTGYHFAARFGAAGSLGRIGWPFKCYPWARARFDYDTNFDAGLTLDPRVQFDAAMSFHVGLDVRAGCAGRNSPFANKEEIMNWNGKSIGLGLSADVSGHLQAFNPFAFDGHANLHVDLPIIPTFDVGVSVSF